MTAVRVFFTERCPVYHYKGLIIFPKHGERYNQLQVETNIRNYARE